MAGSPWWKDKVAYQIYPRSFMDSNGDGVGDLNGITEKLDYLRDLGVDLVWLSPVYRSPMDDGGYDISDYEDINPMFGTMEDMDRLIREAGKRGIRLLMDLVVNHCSDEHPWFQKALKEPDSEEAGYFWFVRSGDRPPNNWASMFGGSAWEPVGDGRWYMHLFSRKQPDLNWENPALRKKVYEMIRFWLDKGLGGFRIDAITHIKKMPGLPSGPAERPDGLVGCHAYTRCIDGIGEFLTELRKETFDRYECITVAEAAGVPPEQLKDYVGENGYFSTMFDFSYAEPYNYGNGWHTAKNPGEWDFRKWRDALYLSQTETQKIGRGAVFLENHDYPRACQKFVPEKDHGPAVQKMLGQLFFYLHGIPFIYQGEELGMTNPRFTSIDQIDDISTKNHYRIALADGLTPEEALPLICRYSRDNARVPFPWNGKENGGFCAPGAKPWLPVHQDYRKVNAEAEAKDPDSVLAFYKEMISIRKSADYGPTVVDGRFDPILRRYGKLIAYTRTGDRRLAVICSLSDRPRVLRLPFVPKKILQKSADGERLSGNELFLLPYQSLLMEF
ncbi:MAG: alpha-glucosidase [Clostridia bacterium]|nr:alpha-glucosidase [Clostridia bacterium]